MRAPPEDELMLRNPDEMVEVACYRTQDGATLLTVRTSALNARWVRALFAHNAEPFKMLHDIGFRPAGDSR